MGEVRSFTEEHADDLANLYFRVIRGQSRPPGKSLSEYFKEVYLRNPWASPEIPALVYVENGKVVGSYGVVPRMMEFRGRPIRVATLPLFMVDPECRHGSAAVQLLGRVLKGPQELSWTDGASGSVNAFWTALGGHAAPLYSLNWIRILRPFGVARLGLGRAGRMGRILEPLSGVVSAPADLLLSTMRLPIVSLPVADYRSFLVKADDLLTCIRDLGWREPLKPLYTPETFPWLMREAAKTRLGSLRMLIVQDADGQRRGWFVYYAVRGGASFVLQIGVHRKIDFRNTLQALFKDAWEQGSVCVKGAAIPQYLTLMTELHCFFRHPYDRVLIHSRNPEIANAIRLGEAAITRLDGIGWLRFPAEEWSQ